jgi:hypothetical protein
MAVLVGSTRCMGFIMRVFMQHETPLGLHAATFGFWLEAFKPKLHLYDNTSRDALPPFP